MFYLISISLTQLRYKSLFSYTTDLICAVWVCINWHGKRNGWKCQKFSTPRSIFPLHIQMCRSFCPLQNKRNKGSFRSFIRSFHNSDYVAIICTRTRPSSSPRSSRRSWWPWTLPPSTSCGGRASCTERWSGTLLTSWRSSRSTGSSATGKALVQDVGPIICSKLKHLN